MEPGTSVQVRGRFDGDWSTGFEVAHVEEGPNGPVFRVRRLSDGVVLPATFPPEDLAAVRPRRR